MKYLRVENFLNEKQNQSFLDWCVNNPQAFAPSTVTPRELSYKRSKVASCLLEVLVTVQVQRLIPVISNALDIEMGDRFSFESQITAHGNGDFFKIHTDKNDWDCLHREISYVYYFHTKPACFVGGELALYSNQEKRDRVLIAPDNNTLVCFPSMTWYEVLPVVGGTTFDESRFSVNGWINGT
jgi:Rps23 Pro-64 3,4-dihydroxylase Tpa1-like proline 4-hydroxylase